ncbi:hypothetical protein CPC08DRAFT_765605 [Agrocybe pediades]|nr:hypothetical protein CPC08DRAFT_765605 [Agrocybe pediades]
MKLIHPYHVENFLAGQTKKSLRLSSPQVKGSSTTDVHLILFRLPIETNLVVFEHLHPIDLYHLSLVSRYYRRLLLDKRTLDVWRTSYTRHPDLPACPPGTSYPQWTFLLFGPRICTECGSQGPLADFSLRVRYCEECASHKFVFLQTILDSFGRYIREDDVVCSMVACSFRINTKAYTFFNPTFRRAKCLLKEVEWTSKRVTLLKILAEYGVPSVETVLAEYTWTRSKIVEITKRYTDKANSWAIRVYRQALNEKELAQRRVIQKCSHKLQNLGYDTRDVEFCRHTIDTIIRQEGLIRYTPKGFRKIRQDLETVVKRRMLSRLKAERETLTQDLYSDYQKTLDPSKWSTLPPVYQAFYFFDFDALFEGQTKVGGKDDINPEFLKEVTTVFGNFIQAWERASKSELLQMISKASVLSQAPQVSVPTLELAAHVFTCPNCNLRSAKGRVLIGWEAIASHINAPRTSKYRQPCARCIYSKDASIRSMELIRSLGLDPTSTKRQDMDSRGDRFLCARCLAPRNGVNKAKAYNWIEYVSLVRFST